MMFFFVFSINYTSYDMIIPADNNFTWMGLDIFLVVVFVTGIMLVQLQGEDETL